jgi:hypothetical protein
MRRFRRSDRVRRPFFRFLAGGCAAMVVFLTILEACPRLHAWLHGEKELDADDDCAVVMLANGVTPSEGLVEVAAVLVRVWRESPPHERVVLVAQPGHLLPPCQGPPEARSA